MKSTQLSRSMRMFFKAQSEFSVQSTIKNFSSGQSLWNYLWTSQKWVLFLHGIKCTAPWNPVKIWLELLFITIFFYSTDQKIKKNKFLPSSIQQKTVSYLSSVINLNFLKWCVALSWFRYLQYSSRLLCLLCPSVFIFELFSSALYV